MHNAHTCAPITIRKAHDEKYYGKAFTGFALTPSLRFY